jgi:poly-gamma-glutamate synthesis protein (capsule biosynthesis protein)
MMRALLFGLALLGGCRPNADPVELPGLCPAADPPALSKKLSLHLAAVGDIIFGRYKRDAAGDTAYYRVTKSAPFAEVASLLRGADIAFANLETPFVDEPDELFTYANRTFRAEASDAQALAAAGFDVVSIANNHIFNFGARGAPITRQNLVAAGLQPAGAGANAEEALRPAIVERSGLKVSLIALTVHDNGKPSTRAGALAYVPFEELADTATMAIAATRARDQPDFVVVSVHWGIEYAPHPENAQRTIAHLMVDAGADVVLGHHPHVVQDIERYNGAVIAYSLGNFLFDQRILTRRQSLILDIGLERDGEQRRISTVIAHPVLSGHDDHIPRVASLDELAWRRRLAELAPGVTLADPPVLVAER